MTVVLARSASRAVMLCRKLLLHIAADNGLPSENEKGFSPNFTQCVDHLLEKGVITQQMKNWVTPIKDIGNEANHKLTIISASDANKVAPVASVSAFVSAGS